MGVVDFSMYSDEHPLKPSVMFSKFCRFSLLDFTDSFVMNKQSS